jgi:cellulose synthase/poly-beta-1,6-N-acetylglucosamine synthase-like glycosyltransferase
LPTERPDGSPWALLGIGGVILVAVALVGVSWVIGVIGIVLQVLYLVYFLRHLSFAAAALRSAPADLVAPVIDTGYRPAVSVLVACKNEATVVNTLTTSLLALDYPRHLLQLVVVDDASDDGTGQLLDGVAANNPQLCVVHRPPNAGGGKSGALNLGLTMATGEIVIIFDADHQPHADVVRRLVRHFEDPSVSAVQGRCDIRNPGDSPIANLVSIDYLAGYLVNEYGRQGMFGLPAYGGANCAVRATHLRAFGGWNPRSVTEDTDLTLRLVLSGGKVRYDITAIDEEEGVTTLERFYRQRYRWARGHQQVWREYRRAAWRSPYLSFPQKVEATLFLFAYHMPAVSGLGLVVMFLWLCGITPMLSTTDLFIFATLLFLGPMLELGGGLLVSGADRRQAFALVGYLPMYLVSIVLCTQAWLDGMAGRPYAWAKTQRRLEPEGPVRVPAPRGAAPSTVPGLRPPPPFLGGVQPAVASQRPVPSIPADPHGGAQPL